MVAVGAGEAVVAAGAGEDVVAVGAGAEPAQAAARAIITAAMVNVSLFILCL